jgi:oligopeptide transport system substrate-binding protein
VEGNNVKNKNKFLLGIVTMTTAGVLAACSNSNTGSSSSKQVMNTATSNEISTLDSSKYGDTTSLEALQNSMKGLYHFDKNNRAKLAGATSVKVSNGNRVYTYNLRKTLSGLTAIPLPPKTTLLVGAEPSILRIHPSIATVTPSLRTVPRSPKARPRLTHSASRL